MAPWWGYLSSHENISINNLDNITVFENAIGDHDGNATLYLSKACNWNSLIHSDELRQTDSCDIQVRKLDSLLEEIGTTSVSFIRMDIEGYEVKAIEGMMKTLKKYAPYLMIELHPQLIDNDSMSGFLTSLKDLGYEVMCLIDRGRDYPWFKSSQAIEICTMDSLIYDSRLLEDKRHYMLFLEKKSVM